jgi:hypothetical protein
MISDDSQANLTWYKNINDKCKSAGERSTREPRNEQLPTSVTQVSGSISHLFADLPGIFSKTKKTHVRH